MHRVCDTGHRPFTLPSLAPFASRRMNEGANAAISRVELVLAECLEARTSGAKARWIIRLSEFSADEGRIPEHGLGAFVHGPFSDVVREILGESAAEEVVGELACILALGDPAQPPLRPAFVPSRGESRVKTDLLPFGFLDDVPLVGASPLDRRRASRARRGGTLVLAAAVVGESTPSGMCQAPRSRDRSFTKPYHRRPRVASLHGPLKSDGGSESRGR